MKLTIQTDWKIEQDRVIIYPFGLFFIISIVLFVLFGALWIPVALSSSGASGFSGDSTAISGLLYILFLAFILFSMGWSSVTFDQGTQTMYRKLFGFLTTKSVRFEDLEGIRPITSAGGGYSYRVVLKTDRFGKGTQISSGYSKQDNKNAAALREQVFPVIEGYLKKSAPIIEPVAAPITSYTYFDSNGYSFKVRKNVAFLAILGIVFIALSVVLMFATEFTADMGVFRKYFVMIACLVGGVACVIGAFSKTVFDTASREVQLFGPFGLGNRTYPFSDFVNYQTVRRTTNGLYSGTDLKMIFRIPGSAKLRYVPLRSFRNTKKIELLVQETNSVLAMGSRT